MVSIRRPFCNGRVNEFLHMQNNIHFLATESLVTDTTSIHDRILRTVRFDVLLDLKSRVEIAQVRVQSIRLRAQVCRSSRYQRDSLEERFDAGFTRAFCVCVLHRTCLRTVKIPRRDRKHLSERIAEPLRIHRKHTTSGEHARNCLRVFMHRDGDHSLQL